MGQLRLGRLPWAFVTNGERWRRRVLLEVKTGVKAGSVEIVEDIVLLKDDLSVRKQ